MVLLFRCRMLNPIISPGRPGSKTFSFLDNNGVVHRRVRYRINRPICQQIIFLWMHLIWFSLTSLSLDIRRTIFQFFVRF